MKTVARVTVILMIVSVCIIGLTSCWLDIFSLVYDDSKVGNIGPAGGYIFYDKGSYSDGWRYLEAAPEGWSGSGQDPSYIFGFHRNSNNSDSIEVGTSTAIGKGKANTEALVAAMGNKANSDCCYGDEKVEYAAKVAFDYTVTFGGVIYDDWFLPSRGELEKMCQNLMVKGLGGFNADEYWSSSEYGDYLAYYHEFYYFDYYSITHREEICSVRPARAF